MTSLTFGTQLAGTTSPAQSVTLTNYGTAALSTAGIVFTGADPSDFAETNTCGSSVAPGTSCTINVTFKPTGINARNASLSITDTQGSPHTVSLTGEGTVVELNPASLGFYSIPCCDFAQTSTLKNTGTTTLSITGITITGPFSVTSNCESVAPGKSCTITVYWRPNFPGLFRGAVWVSDNGGGSPQKLPLTAFRQPEP